MKKQQYKLVNVIIWVTFLFIGFSCEKEEEVNACEDGFLSPGEEQIDCGGSCTPCLTPIFSSAKVNFKNELLSFSEFALEDIGDKVFTASNDTVSIMLNFGDGDTLGGRPIEAGFYSKGIYNGNNYPTLTEGTVVISDINLENSTMSGFFQAKLFRAVLDTMILTGGEFTNVPF